MKSIIEGCFKRPGAVILALILIFFSGINAFLSIPKEASPDVEIPVAYVSVASVSYTHLRAHETQ